ncbi:MAG: hypothetical protein B7Z04_14665 [Rhodobacterales bacterium 32-66-9]|nr:MAG: hypothetical protein B7Z04_14665 [Rhodobacterales bacterium 32-66-9]
MTQPIALIGAGAMGGAIGARLVATGARLSVFDPDPVKVAALVDLGAVAAPSAAEAARGGRAPWVVPSERGWWRPAHGCRSSIRPPPRSRHSWQPGPWPLLRRRRRQGRRGR